MGPAIGSLAIIPARHHEAHIAGFVRFLLTGERRIVGRDVRVPALRRDGSELPVVMHVEPERLGQGRTVVIAALEPAATYDGDASALWKAGDPDGSELLRRLKELPGFGDQKARIFLALLGKQYGVTLTGWRAAAGEYGKADTRISVADIVDGRSLEQVRSHKKQMKAAKTAAQK